MNHSAFPIPNDDRPGAYPAEPGMSLRDYFAANALQGGISTASGLGGLSSDELAKMLDGFARICWEAADAMLRTRDAG